MVAGTLAVPGLDRASELHVARHQHVRRRSEVKFLIIMAALIGGAWYYYKPLPPGKGPEADAGKRAATVILRTLENYRGDRGAYPEELDQLVPDYLGKVPRLSTGRIFEYQRITYTYRLTFNYASPFPVHCTYRPETKWACEYF